MINLDSFSSPNPQQDGTERRAASDVPAMLESDSALLITAPPLLAYLDSGPSSLGLMFWFISVYHFIRLP